LKGLNGELKTFHGGMNLSYAKLKLLHAGPPLPRDDMKALHAGMKLLRGRLKTVRDGMKVLAGELKMACGSVAMTDSEQARMAAIGGRERSERLWTAVACYRFGTPGLPGALK
jgi:hypothetical protein